MLFIGLLKLLFFTIFIFVATTFLLRLIRSSFNLGDLKRFGKPIRKISPEELKCWQEIAGSKSWIRPEPDSRLELISDDVYLIVGTIRQFGIKSMAARALVTERDGVPIEHLYVGDYWVDGENTAEVVLTRTTAVAFKLNGHNLIDEYRKRQNENFHLRSLPTAIDTPGIGLNPKPTDQAPGTSSLTYLEDIRRKYHNSVSVILHANEGGDAQPLDVLATEEHTDTYLALRTDVVPDRGDATGIIGTLVVFMFLLFFPVAWSDWELVVFFLTTSAALFCGALYLDFTHPVPMPILLNRRTREIYHFHDGKLYHAPWDGLYALACQNLRGDDGRADTGAALQTVVHQFGAPSNPLLISLNFPLGKTIETQRGYWAWLQAYMDNGPWLDAAGQNCNSNAYSKEMLRTANPRHWDNFIRSYRAVSDFRLSGAGKRPDWYELFYFIFLTLLLPKLLLQDLITRVIKKRVSDQWPPLVKERLRPNGPTTRLVDLEHSPWLKDTPKQS
jgi:hypothetical protein